MSEVGTYTPPSASDLANLANYNAYLAGQDDAVREALDEEIGFFTIPTRDQVDAVITPDFLAANFLSLTQSDAPIDIAYGGSGLYSSRYTDYLFSTTSYTSSPADTQPCRNDAPPASIVPTRQVAPSSSVANSSAVNTPQAALEKLKGLFVGNNGYYPKTLAILDRELAASASNPSVPTFAADLFTAFLQGWIKDPGTALGNISSLLKYLGVPTEGRAALAKSLSVLFYKTLAQAFGCAGGERLQDNRQFIGFQVAVSQNVSDFSTLANRDGNPSKLQNGVRAAADKLISENSIVAQALSQTEWSYSGLAWDYLTPGDAVSEPLGAVRAAIDDQKENLNDAMQTISNMQSPADIATFVKTFEGDERDVAWIYDQIGIPKNPKTGAYLVDEIYARMDTTWDWRNLAQGPQWGFERTDIAKPPNMDWSTWSLAFQIAREKKKIDIGETVFQVLAIGGSILATIAGGAVAGPAGAVVAGTVTAGVMGGADVHHTIVRETQVAAANDAHHMAALPIGSDAHLEVVSQARQYAVTAAFANVFLAAVGGGVSPLLNGAAEALIPGSKLAQLGLRTVLQGLYGAGDGGLSALSDGRVTNQDYLDRSTALANPDGEAPSWVDGLVYSMTVGALFGAGSEAAFGSVEVICLPGAKKPKIVDTQTGAELPDYRITSDGSFLVGPDGQVYSLKPRGEPQLVVRNQPPAASARPSAPTAPPRPYLVNYKIDEVVTVWTAPGKKLPGRWTIFSINRDGTLSVTDGNRQIKISRDTMREVAPTRAFSEEQSVVVKDDAGHVMPGDWKVITYRPDGTVMVGIDGMYQFVPEQTLRDWQPKPQTPQQPARLTAPPPAAVIPGETHVQRMARTLTAGQQVFVTRGTNGPAEPGWYVLKVKSSKGTAVVVKVSGQDVDFLDPYTIFDLAGEGGIVKEVPLSQLGPTSDIFGDDFLRVPKPDDPELRHAYNRESYLYHYRSLSLGDYQRLFQDGIRQRDTGNCFMVSVFNSMLKSPETFKTLIMTSLRVKSPGIYEVKVPLGDPYGQIITVTAGDLMPQRNPNYGHPGEDGEIDTREFIDPVDASDGFKILEAAYIKMLTGGTMDRSVIDKGGLSIDVLKRLLGDDVVKHVDIGRMDNPNPLRSQASEVMQYISEFHNMRDIGVVYSKHNPGAGGDTVTYETSGGHTLFMSHAYSLEAVEFTYVDDIKIISSVTVSNPHDTTKQKITMSYQEFLDAFYAIDAARIDMSVLFM